MNHLTPVTPTNPSVESTHIIPLNAITHSTPSQPTYTQVPQANTMTSNTMMQELQTKVAEQQDTVEKILQALETRVGNQKQQQCRTDRMGLWCGFHNIGVCPKSHQNEINTQLHKSYQLCLKLV